MTGCPKGGPTEMSFFYTLFNSWKSLWNYKLRTFLAVLGIAISSLLVVFLLAVLHNFKISLIGQIQGAGVNQIVAVPGKLLNSSVMETDLSGMLSFTAVTSTLTYRDALDVKEQIPEVDAVAPQVEAIMSASASDTTIDVLYTGTTPGFRDIFDLELDEGRFFNEEEVKQEERVVVLGQSAKKALFGGESALGQTVKVKGLGFTVVGVIKEKKMFGFNFDERVFASYQVVSDATNLTHASMIFFNVHNEEQIEEAERKISNVIQKNHGSKDFNLLKPDEALHLIDTMMTLVTAITLGITGISFLVGGIGIMNVMFLTVKERTREIGIRKAVGAKSWHILLQFLMEAVYISLIGCVIGLSVTYGLLQVLHRLYPILSAELPLPILGISLLFSITVGLLFGILPAWKAIRIKPVDALRYE